MDIKERSGSRKTGVTGARGEPGRGGGYMTDVIEPEKENRESEMGGTKVSGGED